MAQTERALCRQIDSLVDANEVFSLVEPSDLLRKLNATEGVKDSAAVAKAQISVGNTYRFLQKYQKADSLFREIDLILPAESVERASWLVFYSLYDVILSRGEKVDSMLEAGMAMHRKLGNERSYDFIYGLYIEAQLAQFYGDHSACVQKCLEGIERWKKAALPEKSLLGYIYSLLGVGYNHSGFNFKAGPAFQTGLAILSKTCKPDHPVFLLQQLEYIQFLQEFDLDESANRLRQLQNSLKTATHLTPFIRIKLLMTESSLKNALGSNEEALLIMQKALDLSLAKMPYAWTNYVHRDVANELINLDRYDEAQVVLNAIADSMTTNQINNPFVLADLKVKMADAVSEPAQSIPFYEQALAIYQNLGSKDSENQMIPSLVLDYMRVGRWEEAEKTLSRLDSIEFQVGDHERAFLVYLKRMSYLREHQNRTDESWAFLKRWVNLSKQKTLEKWWLLNEHNQYEAVFELRNQTNEVLSKLERAAETRPDDLAFALDHALFAKSFLLSNTQKIRKSIENGTDETQKQLFAQFLETRDRLAWCFNQPKQRLVDDKIDLVELEKTADSLENKLAELNKNVVRNTPFSWSSIQKSLAPNEAALEIARFNSIFLDSGTKPHYAIFILTPQNPSPQLVFLQNGEQLEQILTEKYLAECADRSGDGQTEALFEAIWKPLEPFLKNATRVFVSADGFFHKINLGALRGSDGHFLAEKMEFRPVFSLKEIGSAPLVARSSPSASFAFLVGNPAFSQKNELSSELVTRSRAVVEADDLLNEPTNFLQRNLSEIRGLKLENLPGSQKEVEEISNLLQRNGWQTELVLGEKATETAIKAVKKPKILHLATHGYFLQNENSSLVRSSAAPKNPMLRSMLFFAGAQNTLDRSANLQTTDDGILTAFETQNLDLENTELVVLSACQTAQGKVQNGEGVFGLQRALRIAGARNLLGSLWDVDDAVGREFMRGFYEKWLGGTEIHEAFRATQASIRAKYPKPFFWAGFVLVGD